MNGEGDYRCTKDEVRNMMRDQSDVSQDLRVLEQLDLNAFDYESVRRYRIRLQNTRITSGEPAIMSGNAKCKIIDYLTDNDVCRAADISELLNLKPSRTREYLAMLVSEGILVIEGGNRNRTYRLKA